MAEKHLGFDAIIKNKIVIGSANFGHKYGFNNSTIGNANKLSNLLLHCINKGINKVDTAESYTNSHILIGSSGFGKNLEISTKISKMKHYSKTDFNDIYDTVCKFLNELKIDYIDTLFFHDTRKILKNNPKKLFSFMQELKEKKIIKKIGVTLYDKEDIYQISQVCDFNLVQVPINIYDQRFLDEDIISFLYERKIKLQARSVFLQGILLEEIQNLPNYFTKWKSSFLTFQDYMKTNNIKPIEACINFIVNNNNISSFVVGIRSVSDIDEIINVNRLHKKINYKQFNNLDRNLIDPRKWK